MTPNTVVLGFYDKSESIDFVKNPDGLPSKKQLFSRLKRPHAECRGFIEK